MTFVHSSTQSAVNRSDDGAALQRRLIQDLERQWLDSWTVADQVQAQAAPAPQEQEQAGVQDLTKNLPLAKSGIAADTGVQGAQTKIASQTAQVGGARTRSFEAGERTNATAVVAGRQTTTSAAAEGLVATPSASPQSERDTEVQGSAGARGEIGPQSAFAGNDLVVPQQMAANEAQVQPLSAPPSQAPVSPGTVETVADAIERSAATQATSAAPGPVGGKSPTMGLTPGMPQPTFGSESAEKEAASAPRQSVKASQDEADAGPRRLMLRETDDQSVLASVRDTELTSSQSRIAADGLARALMEAGYARVQVVVNGQQHRNERNESGTPTAPRAPMNSQTQPTPTSEQERPHGR